MFNPRTDSRKRYASTAINLKTKINITGEKTLVKWGV